MVDFRTGEQRVVPLDELTPLAESLYRDLAPGSVVWLTGDLGAGKTSFVQAITRVAGAEHARSPTFALIHEYPAPDGVVIHVDCYRLRSAAEALDLDLAELSEHSRMMLIEWPERAGHYAPAPDAHVVFSHCDTPDSRRLERVI
ncbi:MAG: tRNA (adenosine(37)-N6)-threonylcarbamoyltransferase complex ATPase subunit type 1 TsaE [Gemmatimonadota bacterium]|nr:MAG: tRNA (adenosine(37)-N6)-threonylcarbamoyltransferase complex ATPase subunit type 1 TsaE [Gemmatimonadota bacterium]